jgi:hypothetical protein
MSGINDNQESATRAGDYHSLPLSTIHIVGYVGLVFLTVQMGGMTYYAWKLIKRAKGTPYFPLALFVGIPITWSLPYGLLIFGAYNTIVFTNIIAIAWLNLIARSLDAYLGEEKKLASQPAPFPELEMPRFSRPSLS